MKHLLTHSKFQAKSALIENCSTEIKINSSSPFYFSIRVFKEIPFPTIIPLFQVYSFVLTSPYPPKGNHSP